MMKKEAGYSSVNVGVTRIFLHSGTCKNKNIRGLVVVFQVYVMVDGQSMIAVVSANRDYSKRRTSNALDSPTEIHKDD